MEENAEYEEEEVVVLAELNGLVDDDLLKKGCSYQLVGVDQEKPVLQLGKYTFLGEYEDQMGSALYLAQSTDAEGRKTWSKASFSDKKLSMQRVFLKQKCADEEEETAEDTAEGPSDGEEAQQTAAGSAPSVDAEPGKRPLSGVPRAGVAEKVSESDEVVPGSAAEQITGLSWPGGAAPAEQ